MRGQMFANCLITQTTCFTSGGKNNTYLGHCGSFVSKCHTTSIHLQSALSNRNNWFLPLSHKWKRNVIKHFVSKSKFQDSHQNWENTQLIKAKKKRLKCEKRDREWNNEWSPSELSFPGRAPLGMQTPSHQKWATYLWKEWLLHPIWFGSPIIS